jgi:hypothetical protein
LHVHSREAIGATTGSIHQHCTPRHHSPPAQTEFEQWSYPASETVTVPTSFQVVAQPQIGQRLWITALLTVLGILLPFAILLILNRVTGKFSSPNRLRIASVKEVQYHRDGDLLRKSGEPIRLDYIEDFHLVRNSGTVRPVRSFATNGVTFTVVWTGGLRESGTLRQRIDRLFKGPYGMARPSGHEILAGGATPLAPLRGGTAHEVQLEVAGTWLFLPEKWNQSPRSTLSDDERDPSPLVPEVTGELLLIIKDGGKGDQAINLLARAELAIRSALDQRDLHPSRPTPPSGARGDHQKRRFGRRATQQTAPSPPLPVGQSDIQAESTEPSHSDAPSVIEEL